MTIADTPAIKKREKKMKEKSGLEETKEERVGEEEEEEEERGERGEEEERRKGRESNGYMIGIAPLSQHH